MDRLPSTALFVAVALIGGNPRLATGAPSPVEARRPPRLAGSIGEPLADEGVSPGRRPVAPMSAPTAYSHGDPTAHEQLMLELVNRARANPAAEAASFGIDLNQDLDPGTITPDPKPPLGFNPQLIASARAHSDWMLATDTFSHIGINGSTPGNRMEAAGYVFQGNWSWGENIAWQGTTGTPDVTGFTVAEHEGLFRSAGHRVNLLKAGFDEAGVGVRSGVFTQQGLNYNSVMTTQSFARSASTPGPLVLGVVFRDADGDKAYSVGEGLVGLRVTPSTGPAYALTSTSGGFAFPADPTSGTLTVTVSGPGLAIPLTKTVSLGTASVKVDFDTANDVPLSFVPGSTRFDPQGRFRFDLSGPSGANAQVFFGADLRSWQNLGVYKLIGGRATVLDADPKQVRRFYQAAIVP